MRDIERGLEKVEPDLMLTPPVIQSLVPKMLPSQTEDLFASFLEWKKDHGDGADASPNVASPCSREELAFPPSILVRDFGAKQAFLNVNDEAKVHVLYGLHHYRAPGARLPGPGHLHHAPLPAAHH
jgi:hypothetical protein